MARSLYLSENWLYRMYFARSTSGRWLWMPFIASLVLSLMLYFPLLGNSFAADDFTTLYRVGVKSDIMGTRFFRPLSDFTIYLNYLAVGTEPVLYHLTNILLHGCCGYMLYRFCLGANYVTNDGRKREKFACICALLFLTYPFHHESVAWVVGRGSIIATFFALATMLIVVSDIKRSRKYIYAGIFFFIGLLAYESIMVLPAIVLLISWYHGASSTQLVKWVFVFISVIVVHFLLRYQFSGSFFGDYEQVAFSGNAVTYLSNVLKVTGRMLLPPTDNSSMIAILFCVVICAYIISRLFWRSSVPRPSYRWKELNLLLLLLTAILVPVAFSVSTRTSEGERLLYFPAVYMNMLFAFMLVELVDSPLYRRIIIISLLLYNFTFLQINNWNWRHASKITRAVITEIKGIAAAGNKVMLVNLPGEYRGAYIFRNSFDGVKFLTGIDNAQIQVANYLSHAEYFSTPDPLVPISSGDVVCFGPTACLSGKQLVVLRSKPNERADTVSIGNLVQIWYWDKQKMVQFDHRSPAR